MNVDEWKCLMYEFMFLLWLTMVGHGGSFPLVSLWCFSSHGRSWWEQAPLCFLLSLDLGCMLFAHSPMGGKSNQEGVWGMEATPCAESPPCVEKDETWVEWFSPSNLAFSPWGIGGIRREDWPCAPCYDIGGIRRDIFVHVWPCYDNVFM